MSDYSDHQVVVRCGGALTAVSCHCHHFMTHPAGLGYMLGWAGLYVGLAGLGCNQHLQHSVSSISINSLHFTADTELELVRDYIYINPQRYSQLVSVTQSGSYAIMHQKVAYLREKKAPNSFTHIGTVDRYLKSDIRYRNGWRGRFSPIRWVSIRAGNKHREVTSFTITEKAFSWLKAHTSMLFTSSSSIQQEKAIVKL